MLKVINNINDNDDNIFIETTRDSNGALIQIKNVF